MDAQLGKSYSRVKGGVNWTTFVSLNNSDITGNIEALTTNLTALAARVESLESYNSGALATMLSNIGTDIDNLQTAVTNISNTLTDHASRIGSLESLTSGMGSELGALHNTVATRCFSNLSITPKNLSDFITTPNGSTYSYNFPSPQIPVSEFALTHGKSSTRLFGFVKTRLIQEGASADDITVTIKAKTTGSASWTSIGASRITANDWGFPVQVWFDYDWVGVPAAPIEFRVEISHLASLAISHTTGNQMEILVMVN
jgi:hypothetical protein